MLIKHKLILSFLAVSLLMGALAGLNYIHDAAEAGHIAQHEAMSIARTIAFDIVEHTGKGDSLRFEDTLGLQAHIMQFKSLEERDIVVVDSGQRIIADAVSSEIGTIFNHDENDEVGQSIKDGQIRTFEEISAAYPRGIKSLVVPMDSDEGERMGAVILEYTPLYREILGQARNHAMRSLFYFLAAVLGAVAVGYSISRHIAGPLTEIKNTAMRIAGGDLDARVQYRSGDELGVMAESFNAMADRVRRARNGLQEANERLQLDIRRREKAEEELRASEDKFRNLFESATDAIFVLDLDGNFLDVNRTAYERLGYTREELMSMRKIYRLHPPEFTARFPEQMENLKRHGGAVFEWAHVKKDGTVMPVEVNVRIIDFEGQKAMISIVRDITERKEAEDIIRASLREKELLLSEVHHRVKNNMAVIIAILNLQSRKIRDAEYKAAFVESGDRIRTMALIHEMLYRGGDFGRIDFNGYVRELANNLLASHRNLAPKITLTREIRDVHLGIEEAIPCGLILNELIINSLKHAFPGRKRGNITVSMGRDNGDIVISVQDDGIGLPGGMDIAKSETLGVQIVHSLVTQLDGKIEVDTANGTKYSIRFTEHEVTEKA